MDGRILMKIIVLLTLIKFLCLMGISALGVSEKTWTYELKEVVCTSSDPDKINITLSIERISRGVYAMSGEIYVNTDIVEGDSNKVAGYSYRSIHNDNNFQTLPFKISPTPFYEFLNTYYKKLFMSTFKECSDLPAFEDTMNVPFEKKTYKLHACQFDQDGLPNHLQDGLYKISIVGSGEVDWSMNVFAEVVAAY